MSQEEVHDVPMDSTTDTTNSSSAEASSSEPVRISKKTGKPVRAPNTYQKFLSEKLREKSEDGKRKYSMKEASELWKAHKGLQQ
ncbi:MAG: hypothetical protein IM488_18285 [Microcystis sp. M025S2]|uniref:hypothetical protein n=1 Tax=Microcystis sp. M025S2 TaxID=2771161 RepID=UPI0025885DA3|nr:hypothetical protein [Microcystis sp. M025S2]MCA2711277.1 hypothetical protein [Microcystis sp. M025S2]